MPWLGKKLFLCYFPLSVNLTKDGFLISSLKCLKNTKLGLPKRFAGPLKKVDFSSYMFFVLSIHVSLNPRILNFFGISILFEKARFHYFNFCSFFIRIKVGYLGYYYYDIDFLFYQELP